ncbi:MAG: DUF362 domain-containing protein [Candidatus Hodarchaeota archaeon]
MKNLTDKSDLNVNEVTYNPDKSLKETIVESLKPLGGLNKFITNGDRVLLKPNFNTGDPFPASSDPEFLMTFLNHVLKYSSDVQIIESSTLLANTKKIINNIMGDKLKELNVPVITEKDYNFTKVDLKPLGAKYLKSVKLPKQIFEQNTKIILLPCLKTHFIAHFTGALKLAVGLMERKQRLRMHISLRLHEKIAELNLGYKPDLIVMDARKIFVTKGPASGKVEVPQKILAGTDRIAVDIRGVGIIQSYNAENKLQKVDPQSVRTIKRALDLGLDRS